MYVYIDINTSNRSERCGREIVAYSSAAHIGDRLATDEYICIYVYMYIDIDVCIYICKYLNTLQALRLRDGLEL